MVSLRNVIIACLAAGAQAAIGRRSASTLAQSYIVELDDGLDVASFYEKLTSQGISISMGHNLDFELFKGCSFDLKNTSAADVQAAVGFISSLPAVKNIWPNRVGTVGNPNAVQPIIANSAKTKRDDAWTGPSLHERQAAQDTWSSHVMTQVDRLRAEGITGKGVKVAVLDTGIDFTHPALGGCFGPGCLVSYGRDYVDNKTEPSDSFGHGTHVAGIIAAQSNNPYNFTGVAPGVTLGAYRIRADDLPDDGTFMLMAMNQAYEDGSDIISLSSGFGSHWHEDPISMMVERIVGKGVIVVVAAGNRGTDGVFSQNGEGSPSSARGVASVGSIINEVVPQNLTLSSYTLDSASNTTMESFVWKVGARRTDSHAAWEGTYTVYAISANSNNTDDGCDPLPASTPSLKDVVVLARLNGNCSVDTITDNLVKVGAQRIMFYGPTEIVRNTGGLTYDVVAGHVPQSQGAAWIDLLNTGHKVYLQFSAAVDSGTAEQTFVFSPNSGTGGFMSPTSSYAITYELDVKPAFSAPGDSILSTYPVNLGSYAVESGTSMATPFVSGVYALLIEARKTKDAAVLQRIISSVAKPTVFQDAHGVQLSSLAPVAQQGAGLIQAYDAAKVTTLLSIQNIAFNDTDHFASSVDFDISNTGSAEQTYTLGFVNSVTMYTFAEPVNASTAWGGITALTAWSRVAPLVDAVVDAQATLSFSSPSITVAPGATAHVTVTAQYPTNLDATRLPVYGGWVTLNSTSGENLAIPYLGVAGSMYNTPVINPGQGKTYMTDNIWGDGDPLLPNTTFVLPVPTSFADLKSNATRNTPTPGILYSSVIGVRLVRALVVPLQVNGTVSTTNILGYDAVDEIPFPFNNSSLDILGYEPIPFNGMTQNGTVVPEGRYEIRLLALKFFGDSSKAEDYQALAFPFNIRYKDATAKRNALTRKTRWY